MGFIQKLKEFSLFAHLLNKKIDSLIFKKQVKKELIQFNNDNITGCLATIDYAEKKIVKLKADIKNIDKKIDDLKKIL